MRDLTGIQPSGPRMTAPATTFVFTLVLLLALGSGCGKRPSDGMEQNVKDAIAKVKQGAGKATSALGQTADTVKEIVADARQTHNESYARWYRQRTPRTGTLPESLQDEEAFYGIRGGFDYERAPLVWPLCLSRLGTKGKIELLRGCDIVVRDVLQIGLSGDWLFGTAGSETGTPEAFAHSVSANTTTRFPSPDALDAFLAQSGVASPSIYPSEDLLKEYMHYGILPFPPWGRGTRTQLAVIYNSDAPSDSP